MLYTVLFLILSILISMYNHVTIEWGWLLVLCTIAGLGWSIIESALESK